MLHEVRAVAIRGRAERKERGVYRGLSSSIERWGYLQDLSPGGMAVAVAAGTWIWAQPTAKG